MRKANVRQAAHGQADKGNEAQCAHHQEGEDVKIQISLKELRLEAGKGKENGSRYAGAQHFRNIGTAADAAHRIEVGFEDFVPQPFSLFRLFFFNGFIIGKDLRFFTVHKGNGYHLFPLFRFGYENGGHRIGEDGHSLCFFSFTF